MSQIGRYTIKKCNKIAINVAQFSTKAAPKKSGSKAAPAKTPKKPKPPMNPNYLEFEKKRLDYSNKMTNLRKEWQESIKARNERIAKEKYEEKRRVVAMKAIRLRERNVAAAEYEEKMKIQRRQQRQLYEQRLALSILRQRKQEENKQIRYNHLIDDLNHEKSSWLTSENIDKKITPNLFKSPATTGLSTPFSEFWKIQTLTFAINRPVSSQLVSSLNPNTEEEILKAEKVAQLKNVKMAEDFFTGFVSSANDREAVKRAIRDMHDKVIEARPTGDEEEEEEEEDGLDVDDDDGDDEDEDDEGEDDGYEDDDLRDENRDDDGDLYDNINEAELSRDDLWNVESDVAEIEVVQRMYRDHYKGLVVTNGIYDEFKSEEKFNEFDENEDELDVKVDSEAETYITRTDPMDEAFEADEDDTIGEIEIDEEIIKDEDSDDFDLENDDDIIASKNSKKDKGKQPPPSQKSKPRKK